MLLWPLEQKCAFATRCGCLIQRLYERRRWLAEACNTNERVTFHTKSGPLVVSREAHAAEDAAEGARLCMSLPSICAADALPPAAAVQDSALVAALCGGLKVRFAHHMGAARAYVAHAEGCSDRHGASCLYDVR